MGWSTGEITETLAHFIVILFILVYMFLSNYAGQEITNYNNYLFVSA